MLQLSEAIYAGISKMENTVTHFKFRKFQNELIKDRVLSRSAWALFIAAGILIMLGLAAAVLDDPVIYFLVVSMLVVGLGILIFTLINTYLDTKERLTKKNKREFPEQR